MAAERTTGSGVFMTGDRAIDRQLIAFEAKVQKKVGRKATRAGARAVLAAVKANAPWLTGTLNDSLKVRALKVSRRRGKKFGHQVIVGEGDAQGLFSGDAFYAGFLEFGTKERKHRRTGKSVGRIAAGEHDFIRRVLYDNAETVRSISINELRAAIREVAKK